jgi:hypothetical protein
MGDMQSGFASTVALPLLLLPFLLLDIPGYARWAAWSRLRMR